MTKREQIIQWLSPWYSLIPASKIADNIIKEYLETGNKTHRVRVSQFQDFEIVFGDVKCIK